MDNGQTPEQWYTVSSLLNRSSGELKWGKSHYENTPMQYAGIFKGCKNGDFQIKNFDIFLFLLKTLIVGTS